MTQFDSLPDHEKWSWAGQTRSSVNNYKIVFKGHVNDVPYYSEIQANTQNATINCRNLGGYFANGICHKASSNGGSCENACSGAGVNQEQLNYLNNVETCSQAMKYFGQNVTASAFKTAPWWMFAKGTIRWGCSALIDRNTSIGNSPLEIGYYYSPDKDPSAGFDMKGMIRICACNVSN